MSLKDQLLVDMNNAFLDTDVFAEDIGYTPIGQATRSIKAVVERDPLNILGADSSGTMNYQYDIFIANSDTTGVALVTEKEDIVTLALHEGGATYNFRVLYIMSSDTGAWRLRVGR